jgi:hypothetical protein
MPRFFFHLRNDMSVDDEEGREFPDAGAARLQAVEYAVDMSAASILEHRKINLHHRIEMADESGEILATVEFGDVISVES